MKILFVDSCVRKCSRTKRLADALLKKLGGDVTEIRTESLTPVTGAELEKREDLIAKADYSDAMFDMAKLFREADVIVFAAPYWDLSFPASLKAFIERVAVRGLTFTYSEDGAPKGLCRAGKLWYVTTMGGEGLPYDFGFGYIKSICKAYYGISEAELITAEGLDIIGNDPERILADTEEKLKINL